MARATGEAVKDFRLESWMREIRPSSPLLRAKPRKTDLRLGYPSWQFVRVKKILSKPAGGTTAADLEVRQLRAAGKRIAADRKSSPQFLAATGMYTAAARQFSESPEPAWS
jgi:hypothetical protein